VYDSLTRGGFNKGAAQVYDIIRLRDGTVCFTMERMYGKTLQELLETRIGFQLVNLIIECLIQISSMLWHLENDIGMNHRDLKPSNIILHEHEPRDKTAVVRGMPITFLSRFDVSFIDFGFSCVGIEEGRGGGNLRAGAGRGYVPEDPCPKDGRDMFMFMSFLYYYTYRKLPVDLDAVFEQWLNVEGYKMTDFLRAPVKNANYNETLKWIYRLAGNPLVPRFKTNPERIFEDLLRMSGGGGET
jgi:serine/threonine protein kinase